MQICLVRVVQAGYVGALLHKRIEITDGCAKRSSYVKNGVAEDNEFVKIVHGG